jgi:hypothetical protein
MKAVFQNHQNVMTLEVPVQRGCAMVRLKLPEPAR